MLNWLLSDTGNSYGYQTLWFLFLQINEPFKQIIPEFKLYLKVLTNKKIPSQNNNQATTEKSLIIFIKTTKINLFMIYLFQFT